MSQTTRILQTCMHKRPLTLAQRWPGSGSGVFVDASVAGSTRSGGALKSAAYLFHNARRTLLTHSHSRSHLNSGIRNRAATITTRTSRIKTKQCRSRNYSSQSQSQKKHPSCSSFRRFKSTLLHQNYARSKTTSNTSSKTTSSTSSTNTNHQFTLFFQTLRSQINITLLKPRTIPIPRWITTRSTPFTLSECFGHASFVLVASSYATDDFLLLRIMAVAGSTSMLAFTYFHPHGRVLWLPFQWNVLFIGINAYRIGKTLYYNSMGNRLSEEMKEIKRDILDVMEMSDFAKLVSIATEETFEDGDMCNQQGQPNPYVLLVIEGEMDCYRDGIKTYSLEKGNFVSELGLHAGLLLDGSIQSCCTIVANDTHAQTRCLRWNRSELVDLLERETGIRRSLKAALSWDIVRKLKAQRESIMEHKISDPELWTLKRTEQSEDRYASIVQNLLTSNSANSIGDFKKRTKELDHYRTIHHIDDEHHRLALKKTGWTLEEYDAGEKLSVQAIKQDCRDSLHVEID